MSDRRSASLVDRPRVTALIAATLVVLPVVGGVVRAVADRWTPIGDLAAVQLRVLDTFTARTPLVGMPSTAIDGGASALHHPGPLHFWSLAVPTRIVDLIADDPVALAVAQGLVNAVLLGLAMWVLIRMRSTSTVVATAAAATIVCWLAGSVVLYRPWNPDAAFVALVALAITVVAGRPEDTSARHPGDDLRWDAEEDARSDQATVAWSVLLAVTFSLAAQPHVVYAVPAVVLLGAAVAPLVRRAIERRSARPVGPLLIALVLCWIGPLVDAVVNGGGNLAAFTESGGEDRFGVSRAVDRLTASVLPWRLGLDRGAGGTDLAVTVTWFDRVVLFGLVASLVAVAVRGRSAWWARLGLALLGAMTIAWAVTPDTLATAFGGHLQRAWLVPVVLVWVVLGVAAADATRTVRADDPAAPPTERPASATAAGWTGALAIAAVVAVVPLAAESSVFDPDDVCGHAVRTLSATVGDSGAGRLVLDSSRIALDTFSFESQTVVGLYADLVRRGADAVLVARTQPGMIDADRLVDGPGVSGGARVLVVGVDDVPPTDTAIVLATVVGGEACDAPGTRVTVALWDAGTSGSVGTGSRP
jgi:hypothetical protein